MQLLLFKTIEKLAVLNSPAVPTQLLSLLIKFLSLEIGLNEEEINIRLLSRLKDIITQNRVLFLLKLINLFQDGLGQLLNNGNLISILHIVLYFNTS